ncbi:MAG: DNA integrity scanning diadenylate cyclase DisA [Candidatus Pacearchaeota archaeon]
MEQRELTRLEILKRLSPGTALREGLDDILRGNHGALVVVSNSRSGNIFEGGFEVNCDFTSKRLAELAKMDGAIILSEDFKKILCANTLLVPDRSFTTIETGTRHQAAERTAKQIDGLVIAVSERRGKITIYYKNSKFVLRGTGELLRRATETLQILEKQREVYNELINNLNILEITGLVSYTDICSVLQRMEIINKMADIINEYIVALGKEGIIVRMRMKEITKGIEKEQQLIIRDYLLTEESVNKFLELSFESVLDSENVIKIFFPETQDSVIYPKGIRILDKTSLTDDNINTLVQIFKNFNNLLDADEEKLREILGDQTDAFKKEINHLREQIMVGKKI